MYNKNVLLAQFSIDYHLWGLKSQADVIRDISEQSGALRAVRSFWHFMAETSDSKLDEFTYWSGDIGAQTGGFLYPDGLPKPCLSDWVQLVNLVN